MQSIPFHPGLQIHFINSLVLCTLFEANVKYKNQV